VHLFNRYFFNNSDQRIGFAEHRLAPGTGAKVIPVVKPAFIKPALPKLNKEGKYQN
jgi:hypothetical protein